MNAIEGAKVSTVSTAEKRSNASMFNNTVSQSVDTNIAMISATDHWDEAILDFVTGHRFDQAVPKTLKENVNANLSIRSSYRNTFPYTG